MGEITQQNYLEILFNDCGYTRAQRNAALSSEFGREIRYLDELKSWEASKMISKLKIQKERLKQKSGVSEDDESSDD